MSLLLFHHRYNLLREQNEGYGKLAAELLSGGPLQPEHLPALSQQIKGHIGTFNLDPNRCAQSYLLMGSGAETGCEFWCGCACTCWHSACCVILRPSELGSLALNQASVCRLL